MAIVGFGPICIFIPPLRRIMPNHKLPILDILHEAERRELEIIAFTDHNSVHGYEQMRQEIDFLQTLERAQRLTEEEQARLNEYRRLLAKITVLPGFEFTSHYGAHILGLFAPDRPISLIEATLVTAWRPAGYAEKRRLRDRRYPPCDRGL